MQGDLKVQSLQLALAEWSPSRNAPLTLLSFKHAKLEIEKGFHIVFYRWTLAAIWKLLPQAWRHMCTKPITVLWQIEKRSAIKVRSYYKQNQIPKKRPRQPARRRLAITEY